MHWNGYNDKPPDLSPVIISADPGTITRMLQQLQWDTLEERRARVVEDVTITSMFSILIFGIYAWIVNMWI
jgi:hypothetical protein